MFKHATAALVLALASASAFATTISPGATVVPSVLSISGLTLISPVINGTISPGTFTSSYSTGVFTDTNNIYCSTCLDFVYIFSNSGPGVIERATMFDFDAYLANVGYASSGVGSINPITVDRTSSGGVIGFNFDTTGVVSGQTSSYLIIQTNATNYAPGTFSLQDGSAGTGSGYDPAPAVPEPSSFVLLGTGLLSAAEMVRRKLATR